MRTSWLLLALVSAQAGFAQSDPVLTPPQVSIVIKETSTGSDLLTITALKPDYPEKLLQSQCLKIGQLVGVAPRGLFVYTEKLGNDPKLAFVKAKFGIDGLIDHKKGVYHVEPLVKAFAGAPTPYTVEALNINFDGQIPTTRTLRRYGSKNVLMVGRFNVSPPGVEYRVILLSQDPDKVLVPDEATKQEPRAQAESKPRTNQMLLFVLVAIGSISAGALVYFVMLQIGRKPSR